MSNLNEPILSVENINLTFELNAYREWTWRQVFVNVAKDPLGYLQRDRNLLQVAKNLNFKTFPGEVVGLIGINGAGKTTLCRCIAGIYTPLSGKIVRKGSINAVFDSAIGVHPELTGRENATLLADFFFPLDPKKSEKVEEALEFSELREFLDIPYRLYSSGMQARLRLSMIAVNPSDLLILDEVFDGADSFFKEKISKKMVELIKKSGSVVFVSHSKEQVQKLCSRVILLHKGEIIFDGAVAEGLKVYEELGSRPDGPRR